MDEGASYSIHSYHTKSSLHATGLKLFSPAGQPISGWGGRLVQLCFQDPNFSWKFFIAKYCSFPHQKVLAAPYAAPALTRWWPRGAKIFTIQIGHRQEIVTEDCLKAQTGFGSVSPAEAVRPRGWPLLQSSLQLHEAADWGGGGGHVVEHFN